ncbi:hypothetical protein [Paracoccus versutus]|uniref:hypothetical protein n=1 Tax=Paracoccus versutus TaxID=34007 RepID=UPI001AD7EA2B|nr:hypothetical protein [Paracoccus versutus]
MLEDRVLAGLKDRLMTPEAAEAAVRSYAEELNRLNREHRANTAGWENELGRIEKQIAQIVEAIADGMYHPSMKEKMSGLEARKQELAALLAEAPRDVPDMLPNAATLYARKIARLIEALNQPEERQEAAAPMRVLIEKIVLTPGPSRGEVYARLHGDLATILEWVARQEGKTGTKNKTPGGIRSGVLVSVVAGAGSNLHLLPEQVKMVAGARNHLYRRSPAPNVILLIKQLEPDGSALFRAAA